MHIESVHIEGFRCFSTFDLDLDPQLNIVVGDNECGKSSLLEAINLVLSGQLSGRSARYELDPYLFNIKMVADYFAGLRAGGKNSPPKILIEAYLHDDGSSAAGQLRGTNNTKRKDCPGLSLAIEPDKKLNDDFRAYTSAPDSPALVPVEYYDVVWRSFANNSVNARHLPVRATAIDTSTHRSNYGAQRYMSRLVSECLSTEQQRELSLAYRKLRHSFQEQAGIKAINADLQGLPGAISSKKLTVAMDMSARSTWDASIAAHLDDLPFDLIGKGEQSQVKMKLAIGAADDSNILLIEEPENHLSHSNMSRLIDEIKTRGSSKQIILTTHSSFVLNKLGLDKIKLLSPSKRPLTFSDLTSETLKFFMKLPGYDTLRLILSPKCILVEGPSDELIVQKAYKVQYGRLPLEDGIDVISVARTFKRFLEIGKALNLDIRVVTDNDGDVDRLKKKFKDYMGPNAGKIRICYDPDEESHTLEPQLLKANSLGTLNTILGRSDATEDSLLKYMEKNKTDYALKVLMSDEPLKFPQYIKDAISI